jgi:hypothetical protein
MSHAKVSVIFAHLHGIANLNGVIAIERIDRGGYTLGFAFGDYFIFLFT